MLVAPATFRRLCRARDLLADADARPTIRAVAREVGISPFHFIRQFEALFGRTPHQFRIATRLARAKDLLARNATVTETCMEVGCASMGSFSALFARRIGAPPSTFRGRAPPAAPHDCLGAIAALPADAFRTFREA